MSVSEPGRDEIEAFIDEIARRVPVRGVPVREVAERPSIVCPVCGWRSFNPNDIRELYCGNCHWWTSDPVLAAEQPGRAS